MEYSSSSLSKTPFIDPTSTTKPESLMTPPSQPPNDTSVVSPPKIAPWGEFFDIHALSFPTSLKEAKTRLINNITHFDVNYINLVLPIFYIFIVFPYQIPFNVFFTYQIITYVCVYLYVTPRYPLQVRVFGCIVFGCNVRVIIGVFIASTVLVYGYGNAWIKLLLTVVISFFFVFLHAFLRAPTYDALFDALPQLDPDFSEV